MNHTTIKWRVRINLTGNYITQTNGVTHETTERDKVRLLDTETALNIARKYLGPLYHPGKITLDEATVGEYMRTIGAAGGRNVTEKRRLSNAKNSRAKRGAKRRRIHVTITGAKHTIMRNLLARLDVDNDSSPPRHILTVAPSIMRQFVCSCGCCNINQNVIAIPDKNVKGTSVTIIRKK